MAQSDNCVFYKTSCIVCVYVDDFMVTAANEDEIRRVGKALESAFKLNDLGTARSFLGIQFDFYSMDLFRSTSTNTPKRSFPMSAWKPVN
jgi:hypothetical protein